MSLPAAPTLAERRAAKLPEVYRAAQTALAKCQKIDECKDWADQAAAIASYAKQAADDTLEKHAMRIRARAIRRCGTLLNAIERSQKGGRPRKNGMGGHTVSKREAARTAGISKNQQVQATRVASVSDKAFEDQIESDHPPSVTELAKQGTANLPFTREQVMVAKARTWLRSCLASAEELDEKFQWEHFSGLADDDDAIDQANRCRNAARLFEEIARCIQRQT